MRARDVQTTPKQKYPPLSPLDHSKRTSALKQQSLHFFPEAHGHGSLHFGFHFFRIGILLLSRSSLLWQLSRCWSIGALTIIEQPENSLRGGHPADHPRHGFGLLGVATDAKAPEQLKRPDRHLREIHALRPS